MQFQPRCFLLTAPPFQRCRQRARTWWRPSATSTRRSGWGRTCSTFRSATNQTWDWIREYESQRWNVAGSEQRDALGGPGSQALGPSGHPPQHLPGSVSRDEGELSGSLLRIYITWFPWALGWSNRSAEFEDQWVVWNLCQVRSRDKTEGGRRRSKSGSTGQMQLGGWDIWIFWDQTYFWGNLQAAFSEKPVVKWQDQRVSEESLWQVVAFLRTSGVGSFL